MLAQSTNAIPATVKHDPGGGSPSSEQLRGAGNKGKGIAGLFSEMLSQAQKHQGLKDGEAAKAGSRPAQAAAKGERGKTEERATASAQSHAFEKARAGADKIPASLVLEAKGGRSETQKPAAHPAQVRARAGQQAQGHSEQTAAQTLEDRRRIKDKREVRTDEAAAALALASGASVKTAAPVAGAAKAKTAASIVDADSTIEKKAERGAERPKLTVLDLRRSAPSRREASAKAASKATAADDAPKDAIREAKASEPGREIHRELSLDARSYGGAEGTAVSDKTDAGRGPGRGLDFQAMMAERMRESWNGEIVKSAHIVLRDGDAGTIRLRLRPESLGNVKIELNLTENNISGRIVVESDEAKHAFERNMNELADAFKQGGFDSARLEVAVGGGTSGGTGAAGSGAGGESSSSPFFSERLRDRGGQAADIAAAAAAYARRSGAVDILA